MGQDVKTKNPEEDAFMAVKRVKELISQVKLPQHLRELGIKKDDIAEIAITSRGSSLNNNPSPTTPEELQEILLAAL
jgi:alcohol dehydrogenase class IV